MGKGLVVVAATVLLLAGVIVAATFLWPRELTGQPVAAPTPPATCENAVSMYFAREADMKSAERQLLDHPHIGEVRPETREQAAARLFGRFDMLEKFFETPHDFTPALHMTADGVDKAQLADELTSAVLIGDQAVAPAKCAAPTSDPFDYISEVTCDKIVIWFDSKRSRSAAVKHELGHHVRLLDAIEQPRAEQIPRTGTATGDEPTVDAFTAPEADVRWLADRLADLPGALAAEPAQCVAMPHPALDGGPV